MRRFCYSDSFSHCSLCPRRPQWPSEASIDFYSNPRLKVSPSLTGGFQDRRMNELAFLTGKESRKRGIQALVCLLLSWHWSQVSTQWVQPHPYNCHILPGTLIFIPSASKGIQDKACGNSSNSWSQCPDLQSCQNPNRISVFWNQISNPSSLKSDFKSIKLSNYISKHLERREFKNSEKLSNIYLVPNTTTPTQTT